MSGDFVTLGILFVMLGPIFIKKKLKVSAIFGGVRSNAPLCFKEHGVHLLFLLILTIEQIACQVFDTSGGGFRIIPGNIFF